MCPQSQRADRVETEPCSSGSSTPAEPSDQTTEGRGRLQTQVGPEKPEYWSRRERMEPLPALPRSRSHLRGQAARPAASSPGSCTNMAAVRIGSLSVARRPWDRHVRVQRICVLSETSWVPNATRCLHRTSACSEGDAAAFSRLNGATPPRTSSSARSSRTYQEVQVQLLGSPQGSQDAPAHLLSTPHRAEHDAAAAAASPPLSTPLCSACFSRLGRC